MKKYSIISIVAVLLLSSCSNNNAMPYSNDKYYKLIHEIHAGYSPCYIIKDDKRSYLSFSNNRLTFHYSSNLEYEFLYKMNESLIYVSNKYNETTRNNTDLDNAIANNEQIFYSIYGELKENSGMIAVYSVDSQGGINEEILYITESYARNVGIEVKTNS